MVNEAYEYEEDEDENLSAGSLLMFVAGMLKAGFSIEFTHNFLEKDFENLDDEMG